MPQAPEIFKHSLDDIKLDGLPPRDDPGFEDAVLLTLTTQYAAKGYSAAIVIQDGHVLGVAVPQEGVEPKQYILGLLEHRFLEDALPALEVMAEMTDDPEILYNYGVCLSEMDRVEESVAPLQACVEQAPDYAHAHAALGFSFIKLGQLDKAEVVLRDAAKQLPDDLWINRNLAGLLAKRGKHEEAKPFFERALAANPQDVATLYGLALSLEEMGPQNAEQADGIYKRIIELEPSSPIATEVKKARSRLSQETMKSKADGGLRMDAVMYMTGAFETFAKMDRQEVAKTVFEIAKLGESGLSINGPDKRYSLESLDGDFSGLQLLSMMHVGLKFIDPSMDSQSGLDAEYDAARKMAGK
ncbi:tetratricopeptide repeat protein [Halomonas sp. 25-S5]|uniref:tetratricopeptide repeat protein n=1 Tax=Halomonas sp. 25-S5 TaxID=2994065 RepID=UPI0024689A74|nr:tetratricopeptide repeat protein [Halomonas sp. 25-S5]